jgi:2-iminobutanoate/2-iminopropanoate deaminase
MNLIEKSTSSAWSLKYFSLVLERVGVGFEQVVMARIFITDFRDYEEVNRVYASYFAIDRSRGVGRRWRHRN